jgi:hypothetical protein
MIPRRRWAMLDIPTALVSLLVVEFSALASAGVAVTAAECLSDDPEAAEITKWAVR